MMLFKGKYTLGQSIAEDALKLEPGSEAAQIFNKLREWEVADINQDAAGQWTFKMMPTGWLVTAGLGVLIITNKLKS